jgi:hypothetical protein
MVQLQGPSGAIDNQPSSAPAIRDFYEARNFANSASEQLKMKPFERILRSHMDTHCWQLFQIFIP